MPADINKCFDCPNLPLNAAVNGNGGYPDPVPLEAAIPVQPPLPAASAVSGSGRADSHEPSCSSVVESAAAHSKFLCDVAVILPNLTKVSVHCFEGDTVRDLKERVGQRVWLCLVALAVAFALISCACTDAGGRDAASAFSASCVWRLCADR